jgi:hypothetical protein
MTIDCLQLLPGLTRLHASTAARLQIITGIAQPISNFLVFGHLFLR